MNREQAARVKRVISICGVSQVTFCEYSEVRYKVLMQGLWKGSFTKKLTFDLADKIARRCWEYGVEVMPTWLITGEGPMPILVKPTRSLQEMINDGTLSESLLDWSDID